MTVKWEIDLKLQAEAIAKNLDKISEVMSQARSRYGEAKVAFEKQKDSHSVVIRKKLYEIATKDEFSQAIDPRTGKSNKDWTKLLIDNAMDNDPDVMASYLLVSNLQQRLSAEEMNVLNVSDEIGVLKARARLISAICNWSEGSDV